MYIGMALVALRGCFGERQRRASDADLPSQMAFAAVNGGVLSFQRESGRAMIEPNEAPCIISVAMLATILIDELLHLTSMRIGMTHNASQRRERELIAPFGVGFYPPFVARPARHCAMRSTQWVVGTVVLCHDKACRLIPINGVALVARAF
jgi:hypothetical protein